MRTLILSCNTGEGHNSCAKAIKEVYDGFGEECVIEDGLKFISPSISRFISWGHSFVYRRLPRLFKFGYGYTEKHPAVFYENSGVYRFITQGTERMYKYIVDGGYDAVICTHVFTSLMLTAVLKKYPLKIASSFVATDYTCSPSTKESKLDCYFIPDSELVPDFECPNIPEEKMISSGVPVRQMFYERHSKADVKEAMGIPSHHKHLVLMCGSMGCGPMKRISKLLAENLCEGMEVTIVCGTNRKLERRLLKRYGNTRCIHVKGFVYDMSSLMDSADLCLTKPGGISISESAVKKLPMVFIDAVAGCEEYNRIYFQRIGGAKTESTVDELVDTCMQLLSDDNKRLRMAENLSDKEQRNAAKIIYEKMNTLTEGKYDECEIRQTES